MHHSTIVQSLQSRHVVISLYDKSQNMGPASSQGILRTTQQPMCNKGRGGGG